MRSKNVLIVIPHLGVGGTEIQTLNTVRALVLGGYKVSVLCLFRHVETMVSKYEAAGAVVYCACPQYNRYGIDIEYPKHLKLFLFLYRHLKEIIKRKEIDVVHVQYMSPASSVILVLRFLLFQRNIIVTSHTMADIYKNLSLVHFIQRHCVRAFTCITERAERSFFGSSQLYTPETTLGRRNHFTIYNALPFRGSERHAVNVPSARLDVAGRQVSCDESQVNAAGQRLDVAGRQVSCDESQVNAAGQRLDVAERQVSCDESQVNAAELQVNVPSAWLGDNQSQSDDSPATSLRFTSNSVAINHSEAAPVLGVVSRLERIKGMDLVVPAFAEVLGAHPEVRLLVVGDGSLRASMEEQAAQLACADHIRFVGRQPQEQLAQWYRQMDIVLMPSRSEGFGLTAIEAMASGCVVVASDVGGLPEVVCDGICGLLHRTEDVADMAAKINTLIEDEALYDRLQAQSLVEVEKYSFERYADAVCDLYERLRR